MAVIIFNSYEPTPGDPFRPSIRIHTRMRTRARPFQPPLFGTAKGRRVNETNALTMPTLITGPDRPPNRRASARANYVAAC